MSNRRQYYQSNDNQDRNSYRSGGYRENNRGGYRDNGRDGENGGGRRPMKEQIPVDISKMKNDSDGEKFCEAIDNFDDLGISEELLRGIYSYGFEKPSPIQSRAIRPFKEKRDIVAQAQSGTGKTGTFSISVLSRIDTTKKTTQAIILAHTRELACQIDMVMRQIGIHTNITFNLSVKGISVDQNMKDLSENPHVVIGTPGRILDMIKKRALNMSTIEMFVIDEADAMLSQGFVEQIKDIFIGLPKQAQIGLYSATFGTQAFDTISKFMRKPVYILVKSEQLTLEGIRQYYINVIERAYKFDTLCELYGIINVEKCIIYCNTKSSIERLNESLLEQNFTVSHIHGDMPCEQREKTMQDFRNGKTRILLASDLLGRGIDVQQVSIVINYDIPSKVEDYLHRIGRSGRFGRKGVAISFVTEYDMRKLDNIKKYYGTDIEEMEADVANVLSQNL